MEALTLLMWINAPFELRFQARNLLSDLLGQRCWTTAKQVLIWNLRALAGCRFCWITIHVSKLALFKMFTLMVRLAGCEQQSVSEKTGWPKRFSMMLRTASVPTSLLAMQSTKWIARARIATVSRRGLQWNSPLFQSPQTGQLAWVDRQRLHPQTQKLTLQKRRLK